MYVSLSLSINRDTAIKLYYSHIYLLGECISSGPRSHLQSRHRHWGFEGFEKPDVTRFYWLLNCIKLVSALRESEQQRERERERILGFSLRVFLFVYKFYIYLATAIYFHTSQSTVFHSVLCFCLHFRCRWVFLLKKRERDR